MGEKDILEILDSFGFYEIPVEERGNFLEMMFDIFIDEGEIRSLLSRNPKTAEMDLAVLIKIRMESREACPECEGLGCDSCRRTGKRNIYR